jgi:hypothetical protein
VSRVGSIVRTAYNGNYACGEDRIWRRVPTGDPVPGVELLADGRFTAPELLPGELLDTAGAARAAGLQDPRSISRALAIRDRPTTVHPIPPPVMYFGHCPVWAAWAIRHWRATRPQRAAGRPGGWARPTPITEEATMDDRQSFFNKVKDELDDLAHDATDEQVRARERPLQGAGTPGAQYGDGQFWGVYERMRGQGCTPKAALIHAYMDLQTRVQSGRPLYPAVG